MKLKQQFKTSLYVKTMVAVFCCLMTTVFFTACSIEDNSAVVKDPDAERLDTLPQTVNGLRWGMLITDIQKVLKVSADDFWRKDGNPDRWYLPASKYNAATAPVQVPGWNQAEADPVKFGFTADRLTDIQEDWSFTISGEGYGAATLAYVLALIKQQILPLKVEQTDLWLTDGNNGDVDESLLTAALADGSITFTAPTDVQKQLDAKLMQVGSVMQSIWESDDSYIRAQASCDEANKLNMSIRYRLHPNSHLMLMLMLMLM